MYSNKKNKKTKFSWVFNDSSKNGCNHSVNQVSSKSLLKGVEKDFWSRVRVASLLGNVIGNPEFVVWNASLVEIGEYKVDFFLCVVLYTQRATQTGRSLENRKL